MTGFDQAQSPRLGQRLPYEGTTVRMFTGADLPEVSVHGQLIYRSDTQELQVYNDEADGGTGAWVDVVGGQFGLLTFVGPEPPNANSIGDLWFDSNDGNHPYRASATGTGSWVSLRDGSIAVAQSTADQAISDAAAAQADADTALANAASASSTANTANTNALAAQSAAQAAQATADGAIRTWYQATAPTGLNNTSDVGDLWFDTDDNQAYRWNGTDWIIIEDNSIAAALSAAQNAQTTADGKITAYYSDTAPVTGELGDLWYDTNDGNKTYYVSAVGPLVWSPLPTGLSGLDTDVTAGNLGGTTPETLPADLNDAPMLYDVGEETFTTTITAANFETEAAPNQGIKIDQAGIRAYPPAGGAPFFDVDPVKGLVIVAGEGTFDDLTSMGGELNGTTTVKAGSEIVLAAGAVPPQSGPNVGETYDTIQFTEDGMWDSRWDWTHSGGSYWTVRQTGGATGGYIEEWNEDGTLNRTSGSLGAVPHSIAYSPSDGRFYVLMKFGGSWELWKYNYTTMAPISGNNLALWPHADGSGSPVVGIDWATGDLFIGQGRTSSGLVRFRWYSWPATRGDNLVSTAIVDTDWSFTGNLSSARYGVYDLGLAGGAAGFIATTRGSGEFRVFTAGGASSPTRNWQSGMSNKVGFNSNDNLLRFVSMDKTGLLRKYTQLDRWETIDDPANTRWVASSFFRDQTDPTPDWETLIGPKTSFLPNKRSKLAVTAPALPGSPGANDPNQVQIYVGKGSTAPANTAMYQQTTPAVGVVTAVYETLATSGTTPKVTPTFPNGVAAKVRGSVLRADQTPTTNVPGTGAANIDGLIPPGAMMMWPMPSAPGGWMICDGTAISRSVYPDLAAALFDGTNYRFGNGDGSTTFNLPNYSDKFPIGASGTKAVGASGGSSTKTIAEGNLPTHTHGMANVTMDSSSAAGSSTARVARGTGTSAGNITPMSGSSGNGGFANTPLDVMPPWLACYVIIKL